MNKDSQPNQFDPTMSSELCKSVTEVKKHSIQFEHHWVQYAEKKLIEGDKAILNPPTFEAIRFFKQKRGEASNQPVPFVIDLGCGPGTDTLPYLKEGFRVKAIDPFMEVVDNVKSKFDVRFQGLFTAECDTLQHITFNEKADIVSCVKAFTWIPKAEFPTIWKKVVGAIKPGGLFSFDLWGVKHAWANDTESYFTEAEIFCYINQAGLKILWQKYYHEARNVVLEREKPIFEYWEFVCENSVERSMTPM